MTILVTGAGGFIGGHVVRTLETQDSVIGVGRTELDVGNANRVQEFLHTIQPSWIVHCAVLGRNTLSSQDPGLIYQNVCGFVNLLQHMPTHARLINIGSGAEFGLQRPVVQAQEQDIWCAEPQDSYGIAKNIISRLAHQHDRCYTLRVFGCFGSGEGESRLLSRARNAIENHQCFVLDRDRYMDMVSVQDVVVAIQHVISQAPAWRDFNVVYTKKHRLHSILQLYCRLHGYDETLIQVSEHTAPEYTGSSDRIDRMNVPLLGLEQGLLEHGR